MAAKCPKCGKPMSGGAMCPECKNKGGKMPFPLKGKGK